MNKWRDRYLMTSAFVVQACAAAGFMFVGETDGGSLFFAIPLAVVSLMLAGNGGRESSPRDEAPPEPAAPRPRLEEMILTLQEDVNRLREDREFYRELYVERPTRDETGDRLQGPGRELTYRLVPERAGSPRPPAPGSR